MKNMLRISLVSLLVSAFIGCGGSSSGESPNKAPSAKATSSISNGTIILDGSGSSDSDGNITKYEWYEGDTLLGEKDIIEKSDFSKEKHTITLHVTDDGGKTSKTTIIVNVENQPPLAKIKIPSSVQEGVLFTLDGSKSSDSDGNITKYEWYDGDTLLGSGKTYETSFSNVKPHKITLKVTDDNGAVGSDEANVTITAKPDPDPEPVDTTKPTATIAPTNGSTNIAIGSNITITFSEEMKSSTLTKANITLTQGGADVNYTPTQSGNVLTLDPDSDLSYSKKYTIDIQNVTDKAGNVINPIVSTFTTKSAPPKLLKTGQTTCYKGNAGTEIPCTSQTADANATGQDGFYKKGVTRRYTRANDIVTDNVTGLEWQDNADVASNGQKWTDANSTYCQNLSLHNDASKPWRLPTIDELETILDYGKIKGNPTGSKSAIDPVFENVGQEDFNAYWSSMTALFDTSHAWYVVFNRGFDSRWYDKTKSYYVRCTRGKKIAKNSVTDNGDGTVTDNDTGLMWQDDGHVMGDANRTTWQEAIKYCEGLTLAGHDDWRLPNIIELKSISDRTKKMPPSLKDGFTQRSMRYFSSSTTVLVDTSRAKGVDFHDGGGFAGKKTNSYYVRCTR